MLRLDKFMDRVKITDNCWLWVGSIQNTGYGTFTERLRNNKKQMWLAHRVSYTLFISDIPSEIVIMHKCDVRNCVNPSHLIAGTQLENIQDCINKGRFNAGAHNRNKGKLIDSTN